MAFPTIPTAAAGRILGTTQADGNTTRTFPNLDGLTKNSGDLLLAVITGYSGDSSCFSSWTGGFTALAQSGSENNQQIGVAYKWSTGLETGTFAVTQSGASGHAAMVVMAIYGAHLFTVPEVIFTAVGTAAADPGALDPSGWGTEDTLWIAFEGIGETSTTGAWTGVTAAPTNYGSYFDTGVSADAVGAVEAAVAFRQNAVASEDVGTFSIDTSNTWNRAAVIAVRPAPPASFEQVHFRGRNDNVSLNSTTFDYDLDTNWTQRTGLNFRVRFEIEETAGPVPPVSLGSGSTNLQYKLNEGAWTNVTTSTAVKWAGSNNFAQGDTTTNIISGSAKSFDSGVGVESINSWSTASLSYEHTEVEFCILIDSAQVSDGNTIQLRMAGTTPTVLPTITVDLVIAKTLSPQVEVDLRRDLISGVTVRGFLTDYPNDIIITSAGNAGAINGAFTLAAFIGPTYIPSAAKGYIELHNGSDSLSFRIGSAASLYLNISNNNPTGTTTTNPEMDVLTGATNWAVVAVTKAAGTTTPMFYKWQHHSWYSQAGSIAMVNPVGSWTEIFLGWGIRENMVVAGVWDYVLSESQIHSLYDGRATQNWLDLSPVALWNFNQESINDPVLDLTGGGADETDRNYTSVLNIGPFHWNYNVPHYKTLTSATETETAQKLRFTPPQFRSFTPHDETDPTTSCTVTLPTTEVNDILIFQLVNGDMNTAPDIGGTFSNFPLISIDFGGWVMGVGYGAVLWARCTGNHAGETITLSGAEDSVSACVTRVSGCTFAESAVDTNKSGETEGAEANMSLSAFNTTKANTLVFFAWAFDDNGVVSAPTKNSVAMMHLSQASSAGGNDSAVGCASISQSSSGSTGNFAATLAAGSYYGKQLSAFALKPPATQYKTITPGTVDEQAEILTSGVIVREFDTGDVITLSTGSLTSVTGAFTMAAVVERIMYGPTGRIITIYDISDNSLLRFEVGASGQVRVIVGAASQQSSIYPPQNGVGIWSLVAVTKTAGTSYPTYYIYSKHTMQTETETGGTLGNPANENATYLTLGESNYGHLAVAGIWNYVLSESQIASLWGATQNWLDLSPIGLWNFNQESVDDPVLDLTENGADETSIVGTTVTYKGPWLWDYEIVGGATSLTNAAESDAAQTLSKTHIHYRTITAGAESNTPQTLSITKTIYKSLTFAGETDPAQELGTNTYARRFDGIDDLIGADIGGCNLTGAFTMAMLLRKPNNAANYLMMNLTSVPAAAVWFGINGANQINLAVSGGTNRNSTITLPPSSNWAIVAVTKTAGLTIPRAHIYTNSNWLHGDMNGTNPDPPSQVGGTIAFGTVLIGFSPQDFGVGGQWNITLSDTQVEELSENWAISDWQYNSGGSPVGLWQFNQLSTSTDVKDITGNGANQISRTGTLSILNGPANWDYSQYKNIIIINETDSAEVLSFTKTIYKSLTSKTETDVAQALSITKTIYEGISSATETDLAQTVTYSQAGAVDIIPASETDNVQTLSFTKTIYKTLSFVGESDAAQTITYTQIELRRRALVSWLEFEIPKAFAAQEKSIIYGSESDSAQALTEYKDKTLTFASETDTTQALSFTKTIHKSLTAASETDSIQALTYTKTIQKTLTPAVETDTTQTLNLTHIHYRSPGAIIETDQAQALSFTKTIYESLIFATESSFAQLLTYSQAQSQTITTTLETDSAQALSFTKTIQKSLTFVTESTQAQSLSVTKTIYKTLVSGDETDSAQVASVTKTIFKAITEIAETDAAQSLTEQKIKILSVSSEIDSAQTLSFAKTIYKTLIVVDETDAGMPLSLGGMEVIVYATETDVAQNLRIPKLSITSETDSAQPLTSAKAITLIAAIETDAATLLDHGQDLRRALVSWIEFELPVALSTFSISYANESDIAQTLTFTQAAPQFIDLTSSVESDQAQALSFTKTIYLTLTSAIETSQAQALTVGGVEVISPILETDAAQSLNITKVIYKTLTPAAETESSESLNIDKQIAVITSSEIDSAQTLSATKIIYKSLGSGAESDIAQILSIIHIHYRSITAAVESESAQTLSVTKVIYESISSATETDAAEILSITHIHYKTLTAALETDTAYFITLGGVETVIPAFETDLAQSLKIPRLIPIVETDIAQSISYTKIKSIISAVESDIAQAASHIKTIYESLTSITEIDESGSLDIDKRTTVASVSESDSAISIVTDKGTLVIPAIESSQSQLISPYKADILSPAEEFDIAQLIETAGIRTLQPAIEIDESISIITTIGTISIGAGFELDTAMPLRRHVGRFYKRNDWFSGIASRANDILTRSSRNGDNTDTSRKGRIGISRKDRATSNRVRRGR